MDGLLFSAELILFRKAFFTLEGVLEDLCPDFAMDRVMEEYLNSIVLKEIPGRLCAAFFMAADDSGSYQSLLSNEDLGKLSIYQSTSMLQKIIKNGTALVDTQAKLSSDFFIYFHQFYR